MMKTFLVLLTIVNDLKLSIYRTKTVTLQLAEYNARGFNPLKLNKQQLVSFLQGNTVFPKSVYILTLLMYSLLQLE